MIRGIRSELFKLRTSPGPWVVLGAALLFTALGIIVVFLVNHPGIGGRHHVSFVAPTSVYRLRRLLGAGFAVGGVWMAAIVGVLCVTGEYRHKVMTTSLLVEPRRWRLLAAKAVASLIWGLGIAVASLLLVGAMGIPLLKTQGGSVSALFNQAGAVLPGFFAAFALLALFGAGLGTLMKNQIAAVVTILAITFIVEPVFDGIFPNVGRWLPFAASAAVAGGLTPAAERVYLLSWWLAAIVLAGWGLVPIVVGYFTTFKQDVT
jgi:ABC-type transport system involved in multi-copper enzyme maturation permease subunit